MLRTYIYFLLWSIWIFAIYHQSTKQDTAASVQQMTSIARWSAPGLFLVVAVGTLAAYDWLMSLSPPGIRPFSACIIWPAARWRSCAW